MTKLEDIKMVNEYGQYEPLFYGLSVKFKLPGPAEKELVERIKNKIQNKDGNNRN